MGAASLAPRRPFRPARSRHGTAGGAPRWPVGVGALTVAGLGFTGRHPVLALVAFGVAAFALAAIAGRLLGRGGEPLGARRAGVLVAHAGIALAAVAVAASSSYGEEVQGRVWTGGSLQAGGYTLRLEAVERAAADGAATATAVVSLARDGAVVDVLRPSLVSYPARGGRPVARPALRGEPLRDVYVSVTEADPDGRAALLRVAVNPLMSLLWASGAIIGWAASPCSPGAAGRAPRRPGGVRAPPRRAAAA
ncbi:hypothetical protein MF672_018290 [Actinomadura sp. ATCC 31491]|uniref:Cytochrome c-type biogenesis protein CcmF C-terminal domain-containing protein n=1 Tax=Actinomadura luzonensis TaxID=2805427 RepID=A0ABT0FTQ9_9ACTN|nr:cytochrome c-type biogenesis CcmF C-terminal domain-containing protein [Actinomadura luzonensis]MCK2215726.1 hypothetical protein [Actinomadura luzonensis]